jgi:hypothetical protein
MGQVLDEQLRSLHVRKGLVSSVRSLLTCIAGTARFDDEVGPESGLKLLEARVVCIFVDKRDALIRKAAGRGEVLL